jgi:hypothetical protein
METVPFTTAGEDETVGSLVVKLQIWLQTNWPHGAARQASTSPLFFAA